MSRSPFAPATPADRPRVVLRSAPLGGGRSRNSSASRFSILLSAAVGVVGLLLYLAGVFAGSILATSIAMATLWAGARRSSGGLWRNHPLQAWIPIFLTFQLLGWIRDEIALRSQDFVTYTWTWLGYSMESAAPGCALYLLTHLLYFFVLHLAYHPSRTIAPAATVDRQRAALLAHPILLVSVVAFLFTYGHQAEFTGLLFYITTNIDRFRMLFVLLLAVVALERGARSRFLRGAAWALHAVYFALGIAVVSVTKMRFYVLEQTAALAAVWFEQRRRRISPLALIGSVFTLATLGFVFMLVTQLKTERSQSEDTPTEVAGFADALMTRGASFHSDAILVDNPSLRGLFQEQRPELIKEFLSGIPMSGLITNQFIPTIRYFDMQFTWAVTGSYVESSDFVSAFTSVQYTFGGWAVVLAAILFGWLHGKVFQFAAMRPNDCSWVATQAIVLPIALHGLQRSDLLGIVFNTLLYVVALRMLQARRAPSGRLEYRQA